MISTHRPYVRPTARQREILTAVVQTGSSEAAAELLGIRPGGVRSAMRAMRRRCGFHSTEQAVYVGTRDGWFSMHETHLHSR